jgi:predicted TIM-barrel fold metal-dependent hydrolase
MRLAGTLLSALALHTADAQNTPVVDVHFHHLGSRTDSSFAEMVKMGVTSVVLIGLPAQLAATTDRTDLRILRSLTLPCFGGRMPNSGVPCYPGGGDWPSLDSIRAMARSNRLHLLGEVNAQYGGLRLDDPAMEPYFAIAEELDLPIGVHLGIGPPGIAYSDIPGPPHKSPAYSGQAGDPFALDVVLRKHPRLRLYVMHAAWPMRDAMLYLLYMHPRMMVDVSVLQYAIPRAAYADYLRDLVQGGFAKRIMFGSDGSAARVREGIDAIRAMDFLTTEQQADILGGNAMRFLRLGPP